MSTEYVSVSLPKTTSYSTDQSTTYYGENKCYRDVQTTRPNGPIDPINEKLSEQRSVTYYIKMTVARLMEANDLLEKINAYVDGELYERHAHGPEGNDSLTSGAEEANMQSTDILYGLNKLAEKIGL